ncbi:MAG: hypothetical protein CR981_02515 [Proteobacteria bacterium]|nr:MAG: hypothetical protein CR981_02515 [Pseudomonadota bacterium]PIE65234.1 MAG: hypothetical protein CSA26_03960 [Desulfobacterales bacterium]
MVTIVCKMSALGTVALELKKPEKLSRVQQLLAEKTGEPLGDVIVIRNGNVLGPEELISPADELVFFPAIAGG